MWTLSCKCSVISGTLKLLLLSSRHREGVEMEYICILRGSNESRILMEKQGHGCKCRGSSAPHTPLWMISLGSCCLSRREWPLLENTFKHIGQLWERPSSRQFMATTPGKASQPSVCTTPPWLTASVQHRWHCRRCPCTGIDSLAELMRCKLGVSPQGDTSCTSFTSHRSEIQQIRDSRSTFLPLRVLRR